LIGWILLANLAAALFLTGLAWSLQLVQLPILLQGDYPGLVRQLALHRRLNSRLMVLPMSVEFVTAVGLLFSPVQRGAFLCALALWLPIGYATVWYMLGHHKLKRGYNQPAMDRLKRANWVRTVCWTARSVILLCTLTARLRI
jgi:hypothetical protein